MFAADKNDDWLNFLLFSNFFLWTENRSPFHHDDISDNEWAAKASADDLSDFVSVWNKLVFQFKLLTKSVSVLFQYENEQFNFKTVLVNEKICLGKKY
jgi:hypothetical protein